MSRYRRTDRINELLREEIALMLRNEVHDPRVGLATITAVEASPELDHARIYYTTAAEGEERDDMQAGLSSAAPFIRSQLSRRLHMRRVPELHFRYDSQLDEATRIERLLRETLPEGGERDEESPPSAPE